ncbi:MAG: TetR/AcrR family transcriptional regulator [Labilithrix sp.]|nr:TetR/AcrR family transcriptional regulator [Labilithrix sp.]
MSTANGKSSHPPTARSSKPPRLPSSAPAATRKRKRLRKEEIILEATRLFAERGYEGASMGDLAERVGLRKASLFHHFPSKDVLYATVLLQLVESVRVAIVGAAASEGSFEARLDALTDALTTTLGSQPHAARLFVREAMETGPAFSRAPGQTGPAMRERLGRTINDVLSASLEFARAGQREGAFNPDVDATQIIVSLIGIHFMPFAIGEIVERFTGTSPFHASFLEQRKTAVRSQVRDLVLVKRKT